ncbi:MAG: hypothetical protein AABY22_13895 [Nanoarchaeota archaeon]
MVNKSNLQAKNLSFSKAEEMFRFQLNRRITILFVRFLEIIESLKSEHDNMLNKLKIELVTKEYHKFIDNVNFFDENKQSLVRKQILDSSGNCIRDLEELLSQMTVEFNYNR